MTVAGGGFLKFSGTAGEAADTLVKAVDTLEGIGPAEVKSGLSDLCRPSESGDDRHFSLIELERKHSKEKDHRNQQPEDPGRPMFEKIVSSHNSDSFDFMLLNLFHYLLLSCVTSVSMRSRRSLASKLS